MEAPWVRTARRPRTRPKQWNRGGGQQRMSLWVRARRSPMKRALFTTLLNGALGIMDSWDGGGMRRTDA